MTERSHESAAAVRLEGVTQSFDDFRLGPLDLVLESGTVLALVGPNGAGKTTTLNCIAGLLLPEAGSVTIFGNNVDPTRPVYRRDVGYVGEESGFFRRWTAERNLAFLAELVPGFSADRARGLAERFGLPLRKTVENLSRGNRTKLSIVATLAHDPRVLLLDEPTAGLDPVVRSEVLDVLWEITEDGQHAVIYSTHVLADISRLADELAFLRDGRLVLRTPREELADRWRRISFKTAVDGFELAGVVEHRRAGSEHQIVTSAAPVALRQLETLGADGIEVSRMAVEEIAVQILKGKDHVARSEG